jgi:anthranilate phosphoribosyltransferase
MKSLRTFLAALRAKPTTPEEIADRAEAARLREEMLTQRLSQRSTAGQNYQSGRGTRQ